MSDNPSWQRLRNDCIIRNLKQLERATDAEISALIQSVVERLAKAKWIHGFAFVTPREAVLHLTELGKAKVEKLAKYLRPFEAHCYVGEISTASRWDKLKLMFMLRIHAAAIFGRGLSVAEESTLTCLLAWESHKLRDAA